jgi:DNA-binding MarR family transcriptional regulator
VTRTIEEERVAQLTRFIGELIARFKETEDLFASRLEVSERELTLLRALVEDGPMITKALGGRFSVPVSTMTGLVDRMEKKGLVRRVPHRRDRRSIELEATPLGALALRDHGRVLEAMARGMLHALPEKDQAALLALLQRVQERLRNEATRRTA